MGSDKTLGLPDPADGAKGTSVAMTALLGPRQAVAITAAIVLFGLSLRPGLLSSLAVLAGTVALGVAIYTSRRKVARGTSPGVPESALVGAIAVFAAATALGWPQRGIGRTSDALETLPALVWVVLAVFVYLRGKDATRLTRGVVVATTIAFTALVGAIHIAATDGAGLDVLSLHIEAAEAMSDGLNPYTDAVTVEDGAPTAAPGDVIEGYVYPPVTGLLYAVGHWTLSDPRYASLTAWLVFLAVVGFSAIKKGGRSSLLTLLLMASMPGWPIVLRAAWTEPTSLALAALAFVYWRRSLVSGVFMGMTLGSKQYFFVVAPLLVLYRGLGWLWRAIWAVVIVVITIGAALVWDFSAFWSAAVEFHMSTPPRPDSQNVVGLLANLGVGWDPPSLLPIATGLAASIAAGIWARTRADWFLAIAFTLAASFVVSSQAFTNYWFLIAGLCGITLLAMSTDGAVTSPNPTGHPSGGGLSRQPGTDPSSPSQ